MLVDDPALTARLTDGALADRQPLRVVVGKREISSEAKVLNDDSRTMVIRTHQPAEVLKALADRTDVLLEGGPTLAGAFLRAGTIDRILAYVAPILLGGPITAVDDGTVTANDITFTSVGTGTTVAVIVIFRDAGSPGASPLIAHIDRRADYMPLAVVPNGLDITFSFADHLLRI